VPILSCCPLSPAPHLSAARCLSQTSFCGRSLINKTRACQTAARYRTWLFRDGSILPCSLFAGTTSLTHKRCQNPSQACTKCYGSEKRDCEQSYAGSRRPLRAIVEQPIYHFTVMLQSGVKSLISSPTQTFAQLSKRTLAAARTRHRTRYSRRPRLKRSAPTHHHTSFLIAKTKSATPDLQFVPIGPSVTK
jgi:hypothetical protein